MTPLDWQPKRLPLEQTSWPDIAPTKANRTAAIWNNALPKTDPWFGMNLWLTKVSTGWNLSGSYGQAQKNRIFYPRNLSQQPITIEGQMPNQYQYDRLVYFVKSHHQYALNARTDIQQPLTFALPTALIKLPGKNLSAYRADAYWDGEHIVRRYYRQIYVDGYITGIKAGHPRWNFAPKFSMELLVSYDYIDEKVELASKVVQLLQSKSASLDQTNAQVSANYQSQLRINDHGGVNDPAISVRGNDQNLTDPDIHRLDNLDSAAFDQGLGGAQWNVN